MSERHNRTKTAVLISGRGSNLASLIAAAQEPDYPAEIVLVVADRPGAAGLGHAQAADIRTLLIDRSAYPDRAVFEARLHAALRAADIALICLAGFMRILSPGFVEGWQNRLINIHPSLLPAFPGLNTHERAIAAGATQHGATAHFVRAETDCGPIIVQGAAPVRPDDTPETLAARVLVLEHRLYTLALKLVAGGEARVAGERVIVPDAVKRMEPDLIWPG